MAKRQHPERNGAPQSVDVPEGWALAPLSQLLALMESGGRPKGGVRHISEGVPSIGGEHLDSNGSFRLERVKFVPDAFYKTMRHGHIAIGDVLIVKDGATTGKVALVREDFPYKEAVVNEHVFVCRPAAPLRADFLFWFLFSQDGQNEILSNFQGSAQGGINQTFAANTFIPVAPLPEQERIVAKIDGLTARVDAAREGLAKVPAMLKRFRQSVLAAACSGRLTEDWRESHPCVEPGPALLHRLREDWLKSHNTGKNRNRDIPSNFCEPLKNLDLWELPDTWCFSECGLISDPDRAFTYGVIKLGPPQPGGVPTLRSSDVRWLRIDESGIKRISIRVAEQYSRTFLSGGEIVLTVRGTLGGVAVVPFHMKGYNVSREVAVFPIIGGLEPTFFAYSIADMRASQWLGEVLKGEVYTGINIRDLKFLPLPIPPLNEQREITRRVEALFKLADAIEKRVALATARAEKLTQSILAKAFRGELVPTEAELARRDGREYKPASALLAQIGASQRVGGPSDYRKKTRRSSWNARPSV